MHELADGGWQMVVGAWEKCFVLFALVIKACGLGVQTGGSWLGTKLGSYEQATVFIRGLGINHPVYAPFCRYFVTGFYAAVKLYCKELGSSYTTYKQALLLLKRINKGVLIL